MSDEPRAAYLWREVTMADMLAQFQGRAVARPFGHDNLDEWHSDFAAPEGVVLDDGTAVVACSRWRGPYGEYTPDIDADPPRFWVGVPTG